MNVMKDFWELNYLQKNILCLSDNTGEYSAKILCIEELLKPNINMLNIGVGTGSCSKYYFGKGVNLSLMDISEIALDNCKSFSIKQYLYPSDKLPVNEFDVITELLVIQHITDEEIIKQFTDVIKSLKDDGVFSVQFAFRWDGIETEQNIENCKNGGVCRNLNTIYNLISQSGGKINMVKVSGLFKKWDSGWWTIHISKNYKVYI